MPSECTQGSLLWIKEMQAFRRKISFQGGIESSKFYKLRTLTGIGMVSQMDYVPQRSVSVPGKELAASVFLRCPGVSTSIGSDSAITITLLYIYICVYYRHNHIYVYFFTRLILSIDPYGWISHIFQLSDGDDLPDLETVWSCSNELRSARLQPKLVQHEIPCRWKGCNPKHTLGMEATAWNVDSTWFGTWGSCV